MAGLSDITTPLVTVLTGVTGITTVGQYIPEVPPALASLPAVYLDVMPPVTSAKSRTRTVLWPIDLVLVEGKRGLNIEDSLPGVYVFADRIIAALDDNHTLGGVLSRGVQFDDPAMSADTAGAFGIIVWKDQQFVGTRIHAMFTVDRVGGFSA